MKEGHPWKNIKKRRSPNPVTTRKDAMAQEDTREEPKRVLTVRMPLSLYKRLFYAGHATRRSMNTFAVDALTRAVETVEGDRADAEGGRA